MYCRKHLNEFRDRIMGIKPYFFTKSSERRLFYFNSRALKAFCKACNHFSKDLLNLITSLPLFTPEVIESLFWPLLLFPKVTPAPALWSLLRSEIPSGMCAKLRTVAASNNRDHASQSLLLFFARATHIYFCSSRISRSWWIIQSTQHTGEVATTSPPFYNEPLGSHVLCVKAELGTTSTSWSQHHFVGVSLSENTGSIGESDSLCPMKWRRRHTGSRLHETRSKQGI